MKMIQWSFLGRTRNISWFPAPCDLQDCRKNIGPKGHQTPAHFFKTVWTHPKYTSVDPSWQRGNGKSPFLDRKKRDPPLLQSPLECTWPWLLRHVCCLNMRKVQCQCQLVSIFSCLTPSNHSSLLVALPPLILFFSEHTRNGLLCLTIKYITQPKNSPPHPSFIAPEVTHLGLTSFFRTLPLAIHGN